MDVDPLVFGRRLRHHRKQAGLTLAQLGEKVGRPAPFLSMLENGRRSPKPEHVDALAAALDIAAGSLTHDDAPTVRAELEIELERAQQDPRFNHLDLPYLRPSPTMSDELLAHLVGLYRAVGHDGTYPLDEAKPDLRRANAAVGAWMRGHNGYLSDLEAVATGILATVGHSGDGPLSSRVLLDIAGHLGFTIEAVDDMVPGVRSITDDLTGRIYIAQRNELRTRQARKAVLQTLARKLLSHGPPSGAENFLRQRVETAYLAAAILVPESAAVPRLRQARDRRDLTPEDIKENFYVSYEMASWRFVNLATERLGMVSHLAVVGEDGRVVKGYANDGVPFRADSAGGIEGQPACRRWGAVAVFDSVDKFDEHAQYTDTSNGTYLCVTHLEPDRPFAVTVGVPFESAQWFRNRQTDRRNRSTCPDSDCCQAPTGAQLSRWNGKVEVSVRNQDRILGALATGLYPPEQDRRVYDLVEKHSP